MSQYNIVSSSRKSTTTKTIALYYYYIVLAIIVSPTFWKSTNGSCFCHGFVPSTPSSTLPPTMRRTTTKQPSPSYTLTTTLYGIPKMFRWLTDQYPDIINNRLEEGLAENIHVHNFYLDMNGIIHPCTHGNNNNADAATSESDLIVLDEQVMFRKIFLYIDRLYKMVQPSQVLFLAVDGVAPRAKMNQQRSRRFRSAKDAELLAAELSARENAAANAAAKNNNHNHNHIRRNEEEEQQEKQRFDSNCITPGTDFMLKLSLSLQKWVQYKLDTDPFWQTNGATVIVSGPDVPGEGEHKVMDFIRDCQTQYRNNNDDQETEFYGKGWTHVLYGLDADLIMLGLVTHEPNFMLLREKMSVVMAGRGRNKYRKKKDMMEYTRMDFELLELSSLRKLLAIQFRTFAEQLSNNHHNTNNNYSLERIIDDFVFMCMLVGNDFLSHCPHLEIDSGALSMMMTTYIDLLPEWKGYLTEREKINPQRFEQFMYQLSIYEEEHFRKRGSEENEPGWKLPADNEQDKDDFYGTYFSGAPTPRCAVKANVKGSVVPPPPSQKTVLDEGDNGVETKTTVPHRPSKVEGPTGNRNFRRLHPNSLARSYRDFYYESKMGWRTEDRERTLFLRRAHVRDYMEGLHWCLSYYHNGVSSWNWYFPYLYSPLATDMVNLNEFYHDDPEDAEFKSFKFDLGEPFPSLAQLLSVLPPQSANLLPEALGELMLNPASPLLSYYPPDFTSDPNGKRQTWEAVVQIPFIDGDLLLETVEQVLEKDSQDGSKKLLSPSERRRNQRGQMHIFKAKPPVNGDLRPEQHNSPAAPTSSTKKAPPKKKKLSSTTKVRGGNLSKPKTVTASTTASGKTTKKGTKKSKTSGSAVSKR